MRIFQKDNLFDGKAEINRNGYTSFLVKLVRLGKQVWIWAGCLLDDFKAHLNASRTVVPKRKIIPLCRMWVQQRKMNWCF